MYYLCMRKSGWCERRQIHVPCLHMEVSKGWVRKMEDPLAWGQGWSCACGSGYKHASGTLIEMLIPGVGRCYCLAPVPDPHVEDARAMFYEQTLKPMTPEELYEKVPAVKPTVGDIVSASTAYPGWYKLDEAAAAQLPTFDWFRLFAIFGLELPPAPPTKREAKAARMAAWENELAAKRGGASASSGAR